MHVVPFSTLLNCSQRFGRSIFGCGHLEKCHCGVMSSVELRVVVGWCYRYSFVCYESCVGILYIYYLGLFRTKDNFIREKSSETVLFSGL